MPPAEKTTLMNQQSVIQSCSKGIIARPAWSLLLLAHLPFGCVYFHNLWKFSPHYHFFPFAILAFVWLFIKRRADVPENWSTFPRILVGLDVLLLGLGTLLFSPWVVVVGLFLSLLAWCWVSRDCDFKRRLTYLALLPALLVRLPQNGDVHLTDLLQTVTTGISSSLLLRLGFLHVQQGNVLEFVDRRFLVEEACSGVQSLFTILFLAALIVCWKRRTLAYAFVFIPSGLIFAGIMNVMRITSIAIAWEKWKIDLSTGVLHDVIGYACLIVAAGLLMSADMCLSFITDPIPDVRRPGAVTTFYNPLISLWNWFFGYKHRSGISDTKVAAGDENVPRPRKISVVFGTGLLCCVTLLFQSLVIFGEASATTLPAETTGVALLQKGNLKAEISGFVQADYNQKRRDAGSDTGEFSNTWLYTGDAGNAATVSCDHPFSGWHSLQDCYIRTGWHVDSREIIDGPDGWDAVLVRMSRPHGEGHSTLLYSHFDRAGRTMQPPGLNPLGSAGFERLLRNRRIGLLDGVSIQSQVFSKSLTPLMEDEVQQLTDLHFAAREQMRKSIEQHLKRES
jgi:exosortase